MPALALSDSGSPNWQSPELPMPVMPQAAIAVVSPRPVAPFTIVVAGRVVGVGRSGIIERGRIVVRIGWPVLGVAVARTATVIPVSIAATCTR